MPRTLRNPNNFKIVYGERMYQTTVVIPIAAFDAIEAIKAISSRYGRRGTITGSRILANALFIVLDQLREKYGNDFLDRRYTPEEEVKVIRPLTKLRIK